MAGRGAAASEANGVHRRCGYGCDRDRVSRRPWGGGARAAREQHTGRQGIVVGQVRSTRRWLRRRWSERRDGPGQPAQAGDEGVSLGCCRACGHLAPCSPAEGPLFFGYRPRYGSTQV